MSNEYPARSLYEASYLYAIGIPLATVTGKPGSARWLFDNKDGMAQSASRDFYADAPAPMGARFLFTAMAQLKREADQILGRTPRT